MEKQKDVQNSEWYKNHLQKLTPAASGSQNREDVQNSEWYKTHLQKLKNASKRPAAATDAKPVTGQTPKVKIEAEPNNNARNVGTKLQMTNLVKNESIKPTRKDLDIKKALHSTAAVKEWVATWNRAAESSKNDGPNRPRKRTIDQVYQNKMALPLKQPLFQPPVPSLLLMPLIMPTNGLGLLPNPGPRPLIPVPPRQMLAPPRHPGLHPSGPRNAHPPRNVDGQHVPLRYPGPRPSGPRSTFPPKKVELPIVHNRQAPTHGPQEATPPKQGKPPSLNVEQILNKHESTAYLDHIAKLKSCRKDAATKKNPPAEWKPSVKQSVVQKDTPPGIGSSKMRAAQASVQKPTLPLKRSAEQDTAGHLPSKPVSNPPFPTLASNANVPHGGNQSVCNAVERVVVGKPGTTLSQEKGPKPPSFSKAFLAAKISAIGAHIVPKPTASETSATKPAQKSEENLDQWQKTEVSTLKLAAKFGEHPNHLQKTEGATTKPKSVEESDQQQKIPSLASSCGDFSSIFQKSGVDIDAKLKKQMPPTIQSNVPSSNNTLPLTTYNPISTTYDTISNTKGSSVVQSSGQLQKISVTMRNDVNNEIRNRQPNSHRLLKSIDTSGLAPPEPDSHATDPERNIELSGQRSDQAQDDFMDGFITLDSTFEGLEDGDPASGTKKRRKASDFFDVKDKPNEAKTIKIKGILKTDPRATNTIAGPSKHGQASEEKSPASDMRTKPEIPCSERNSLEVCYARPSTSKDDVLAQMNIDNAIAAGLEHVHPVSGYQCVLCRTFYLDYPTALHHCTMLSHKMKVMKELSDRENELDRNVERVLTEAQDVGRRRQHPK